MFFSKTSNFSWVSQNVLSNATFLFPFVVSVGVNQSTV